MATVSTARVELHVRAPIVNDAATPGNDPGQLDLNVMFSSSEITKRHRKVYTIAASSSTSLDLVSALLDAFGNALTFATVKMIVARNRSTSSTAAASIGWSSNGVPFISAAATSPFQPLYVWINKNGTTVTAGTGDLIVLANADANASADIELFICGT